jgi:hypothetical protein
VNLGVAVVAQRAPTESLFEHTMLRVLTSPLTSPSSSAVLGVTEHGAFDLRARSSDERALGVG